MKLPATLLAMASLAASAQAEERKPAVPRVAPPDVRAVAPALADYTDECCSRMSGPGPACRRGTAAW